MILRRTIVIAVAWLQAACGTTELADFRSVEVYVAAAASEPTVAGLPVRSGQVIIREASSSMAFLMNLMAEDYAPFGHAGVIVVEPEGAFVYDAFGLLTPQFWRPPTRRLRGRIRRLPLLEFMRRGTVSAIYEHSEIDLDAVAAFAEQAHKDRLSFDGLFDYRTPNQVYCSEFVAAALRSAGNDNITPTPRTNNASLNQVMGWLQLDTPGFLLSAHLVKDAREVARISPRRSASQVDAHFAFERELHRRFKADQKLGNIFRWTSRGPRIRPHLFELYQAIMRGADESDSPKAWAAQQVSMGLRPSISQMANRSLSSPAND